MKSLWIMSKTGKSKSRNQAGYTKIWKWCQNNLICWTRWTWLPRGQGRRERGTEGYCFHSKLLKTIWLCELWIFESSHFYFVKFQAYNNPTISVPRLNYIKIFSLLKWFKINRHHVIILIHILICNPKKCGHFLI